MKRVSNWKEILKKAWSIRLGAISALFAGAQVVVPLYSDSLPRTTFAVLSFVTVVGAMVARIIDQKDDL